MKFCKNPHKCMEIMDPKLSNCYKEMYAIGSSLYFLVQIGKFGIPYFYAFATDSYAFATDSYHKRWKKPLRDAYFKSICLEYVYMYVHCRHHFLLKKDFKLIYCVFSLHVCTGLEDRRPSASQVAGL